MVDDRGLLARAHSLHQRGVQENSAGRPARGGRLLMRALAVLQAWPQFDPGEPDHASLVARVLVSLAKSEADVGQVQPGLATLDRAQVIAQDHGLPALSMSVRYQRGLLYLRSGRIAEALVEFDASAALIGFGAPIDQCNLLLNRSLLHMDRGALNDAQADLDSCLRIATSSGLPLLEFMATHNLGYLAFLRGNLPLALQAMDDAAAIPAGASRGIALLDRARVLTESGLAREADGAIAEAISLFVTAHLMQEAAEAYAARAECALLAGEFDAARRFAAQARARFRRRGNERWRRAAERLVLTADLMRGRASTALATRARQLAVELAADGQPAQARTALLVAAEALLDLGRVAEARATAASAGRPARGEPVPARMQDRYLQARLAAAGGDRPGATREVRAGLRELAAYQARFGSLDLQTASAVHGRRLADLGVTRAIADGAPWRVLAAVEQGRAVSSRLPSLRPPTDERAAELLAELRRTVEESRAAQGQSAARLAQRRRQLERDITARSWTVAGAGTAQRPASAALIRQRLDAVDATFVCYLRADGELHAVVAGPRRASLVALGPADPVDSLIRRLRADLDVLAHDLLPAGLRAAASASRDATLAALDDRLLAPLRLPPRRVVITPTGALATVPWGMVPSLVGVPVTVAPTATAWLAAAAAPRHGAGTAALAGPDLPRAAGEVAKIAAAWPGGRGHEAADRATLAASLADCRLVHVAAHGTHQPENPLFSSIRLGDGPLFAYEIDQAPEHVVLSACELGLATIRPGDEALGLTSVLLRLGSRCVVAGVARVGDATAAEVMVRYHAALATGQDSAQSLAEALAAQPAPFVCFGAAWTARDGS